MTVSLTAQSRSIFTGATRLTVLGGPDKGTEVVLEGDHFTIGTDKKCDLVLTDPTVSRRHCELRRDPGGATSVHDLGSTNCTRVAGYRIDVAFLKPGALITLGKTHLRFDGAETSAAAAGNDRLGLLLGGSPPMQRLYQQLRMVAKSAVTVLIEGETGTGKELVAETIHALSNRSSAAFGVFDCAAISKSLVETELFGHEKGAFTGANEQRAGILESSDGGTVFLDEIGELDLDLQPKLLRVLERQQVARVGSSVHKKLNVRIISATHRNLAADVRAGEFRSDLYYRLNVVRIRVPSLRERREDIPMLADHFYKQFTGEPDARAPEALLSLLFLHDWPGNVRELRSAVERWVLLGGQRRQHTVPVDGLGTDSVDQDVFDMSCSFRTAKARLVSAWEQSYLQKLMLRHGGNISAASRAVQMSRNHLTELLQRYEVVVKPS